MPFSRMQSNQSKQRESFEATANDQEDTKTVDNNIVVLFLLKLVAAVKKKSSSEMSKNIASGGGGGNIGNSGRLSMEENSSVQEDDQISRMTPALSAFQAREEEIERKKMEVRQKVELQLGRAEEETKRLTKIWEELEELADPMRKEVAMVRKRIDMANRELKPLGQSCLKKEKEYKEATEAFNEKNKEKAQLVATLMELLTESEKLRMKKLEELGKIMESIK